MIRKINFFYRSFPLCGKHFQTVTYQKVIAKTGRLLVSVKPILATINPAEMPLNACNHGIK